MGRLSGFRGYGERSGKIKDPTKGDHDEKDAVLPADHPHIQLYDAVVPIWCGASQDDLDWEIGDGYSCGFSAGFERGIITAMLKPEWAQGLYHMLRTYYLQTHTLEDLQDWEDNADKTARAIPVTILNMDGLAAQSIPRQRDDPPPILATWGEPNQ